MAGHTVATEASVGGIGLAPAHPDASRPVTESYFVLDVAAGQSSSDAVLVSNTAGTPAEVQVDAVDGVTGVTSGAVYGNRGAPVQRAGAWITPEVASTTVGAQSRSTVGFTVRVPAGATPGDHLAGLAFEHAHPSTAVGRLAVTTVTRSVIGILVHVPGPSSFHLHIDRAQILREPSGSGPSVVLTLGNDGTTLGKPSVAITVDGPSGYHRFLYRELDTVLPGDTIPYPVALEESLGPGDYRIAVMASEDTIPSPVRLVSTVQLGYGVLGVQATRSPTTDVSPTSNPLPVWLIMSLVAAAVAGGAGGAALTWRLAHRE